MFHTNIKFSTLKTQFKRKKNLLQKVLHSENLNDGYLKPFNQTTIEMIIVFLQMYGSNIVFTPHIESNCSTKLILFGRVLALFSMCLY